MLSEEEKKELLDSLKNSLSEIVKDTVKNALDEKHAEDKKNAEDEDHRQLIREIAAVSAKGESDFEGGLDEKVRTIIGLAEKLGYSKDEAKHNAEDEEDKKDEEEKKDEESEDKKDNESDDDSKENKCNEDEKDKEEEKKSNSKFFDFLHNAKSANDKEKKVATMASGLALGRKRYGSN